MTKLHFLFFIALVLSICGLIGRSNAAAVASVTMPKQVFQTKLDLHRSGEMFGVYTNPEGVNGSSSPFVIFYENGVQSVSESGQVLGYLNTTEGGPTVLQGYRLVDPVLHHDAATIVIAAMKNSSVMAFVASSWKPLWMFTDDDDGFPVAMVDGGDYVSVLMCNYTLCSTRFLNKETGTQPKPTRYLPVECGPDGNNPGDVLSFPASNYVQSAMFVFFPAGGGFLVGIDAFSGEVKYTFSWPDFSFGSPVPGSSPNGGRLFAYILVSEQGSSSYPVLAFRDIQTGSIVVQSRLWPGSNAIQFCPSNPGSSIGWTASSKGDSGVIVAGRDAARNTNSLLFMDAQDGVVTAFTNMSKSSCNTLNRFTNFGGQWTMNIVTNNNVVSVAGWPSRHTSAEMFNVVLPVSSDDLRSSSLASFKFSNPYGSDGLVAVVTGGNEGVFTVFRL